MNEPTPEMVNAAARWLRLHPRWNGLTPATTVETDAADLADYLLRHTPPPTGVTVRVAPGVTLHGDTPAFTATAAAPPAAIARLLRQLADDLDRQQPLHEWQCPACGATTRARMADQGAGPPPRCTCMWTGDRDLWTRTLPDPTCPAHGCDCPIDHGEKEDDE